LKEILASSFKDFDLVGSYCRRKRRREEISVKSYQTNCDMTDQKIFDSNNFRDAQVYMYITCMVLNIFFLILIK